MTTNDWPYFDRATLDVVADVLRSGKVNYWTGTEGREFEREFAEWVATRHAIALANGTVALDVALKALGVGAGDEVIVTPRTFIASVSSVVNAGAIPVFADVDIDSQNITADTICANITKRTRAIILVHLAGWPCEMDSIMAMANEHDLYVIEDCAQAHGAQIRGQSVGSFGQIGTWSFCQDKIMTTGGEGGMVTLNDDSLWSLIWSYKDHGKSYDAVYNDEHPPGFRWVHDSFGTNWRMTEIQAAIGRIQLGRIAEWHEQRKIHAEYLADSLSQCAGLRVPMPPAHIDHAWYRFSAFVREEKLKSGWSRDRILAEINSSGVLCFQGICPEVYLEKAFDGTGWRPAERLPVARELGKTSMMFLVHPTLSEQEVWKVCDVVHDVMERATL